MASNLTHQSKRLFSVPVFLAPAFSNTIAYPLLTRSFSSSPSSQTEVRRGNRDKSRKRGVSAIRSTGPKHPLSVSKLGPLPQPVANPKAARAEFEANPNHGLWGFFNTSKEAIVPPQEEFAHGRSWTKTELSRKGWQDLHRLYWTCVKEGNAVCTRNNERRRLYAGYGHAEGITRLRTLKTTMQKIRETLSERHHAHFDAQRLLDYKYVYELFPEVLHRNVQLLAPEYLEQDTSSDGLPSDKESVSNPMENMLDSLHLRDDSNTENDKRRE